MKVLVADKFEKVGLDGLRELGCNVQYSPDVPAAGLAEAIRAFDPKVLIVRGKKVNAASLEAGRRARAGDSRRRRHRHDRRRGRLAPRRVRLQLPGQEQHRGGRAGARPHPRPATGGFRTRRPTSGAASGTRASTPRPAACTAAPSASWGWARSAARSRSGRSPSACGWWPGRASSPSRTPTRLAIGYCQTPLEVARQSDVVSINVAATAETKQLVNRGVPRRHAAGRLPDQHRRAARWWTRRRWREAVREKGIRAGLDVYQDEPAGNTGEFKPALARVAGRVRHPSRRRLHRPGPGRDRPRDHPDRPGIPGDGRCPELRQPAGQELGHARTLGPAPESSRRAGPRVRGAERGAGSTSKKSRTSSTTARRRRWRGSICPPRRRPARMQEIRNGNPHILSADVRRHRLTAPTTRPRSGTSAPGRPRFPSRSSARRRRTSGTSAGSGIGIVEHSHRGKIYETVNAEAEATCRELAGIPTNYKVLFLQGGASLQFAMVPMNLLPAGRTADYIVTGVWSAEGRSRKPRRSGRCTSAFDGAADELPPDSAGLGDQATPPIRRTCTSPPTTRSTAPSGARSRRFRPACRWSPTPRATCSAARSTCRSTG